MAFEHKAENRNQNQRGRGNIVVCSIFFLSVDHMVFRTKLLVIRWSCTKKFFAEIYHLVF